jgi:C-terminal processing protease CtpA/Prc
MCHEQNDLAYPFAQVTPNGPAYLDGTIRTGDRVITVNGQDIRYERKISETEHTVALLSSRLGKEERLCHDPCT